MSAITATAEAIKDSRIRMNLMAVVIIIEEKKAVSD